MFGRCAKQTVIAIIENHGRYWVGTNWCENAQLVCPRGNMKTGEGYELCRSICGQVRHAEVDACYKAGEWADGGILYLIGHDYCCDECKTVMEAFGIRRLIIGELPPEFKQTKPNEK